jgi:hypothetical protein
MIAQARLSAQSSLGTVAGQKKEPNSPRLLPAGSPGPITPLELEMDGDEGYIIAGHRARGESVGLDADNKVEQRRSTAA